MASKPSCPLGKGLFARQMAGKCGGQGGKSWEEATWKEDVTHITPQHRAETIPFLGLRLYMTPAIQGCRPREGKFLSLPGSGTAVWEGKLRPSGAGAKTLASQTPRVPVAQPNFPCTVGETDAHGLKSAPLSPL